MVGIEEFQSLSDLVQDLHKRLRQLEALLFHIPNPDIQRIIKIVEAAVDAEDVEVPENQPELELGPEPEMCQREEELKNKARELDVFAAIEADCAAAATAVHAVGDPIAAVNSMETLAQQAKAQQEFKDNVMGTGVDVACGVLPRVGEIWRFTDVTRIFHLFDDEFGRASRGRMGPTKGTRWREETGTYPQLVIVVSTSTRSDFVEVRGKGDTASWLKGWVRIRDHCGRPLLGRDTF